jgi:tRNA/tmRNA/rRNA uracil-C5-methylase (TrmA/RlmC/RlmD family)
MIKKTRASIIKKRGYPDWIKGDKLSLYISNYPETAQYLASRIGNKDKIVCEFCCAVGISLIELAKNFKEAIGIDIDKKILESCEKNLIKAGLYNKTKLILGDISKRTVLKKIKADIVIYDIPYWNIGLTKDTGLEKNNPNLKRLIKNTRELITKDIIVCAPPRYGYEEAKKDLGECECESILINDQHDRNYMYLGKLINKPGSTQVIVNRE